jgi:phosphoribosylcarboxyaminoimidazole (NCAIR) mutase
MSKNTRIEKSKYATETPARIFEFLEKSGIATASISQHSEIEILTKSCQLLPLIVVARRYATGSFLQRHPTFMKAEEELPHRFHSLWIELFPKSTDTNPLDRLAASEIISAHIEKKQLEELARKTFLVLEGAWNYLGYGLIDLQLEFGVTGDGTLVVADVIDNDALLAQFANQFRIPEQAIVLWRGSDSDPLPEIPALPGLKIETPVISGHKKTVLVTKELERLHTLYPEGGVIIALVGMSNGLGPILAARTNWPLISVCTTANEYPQDVWSALRMPSNVPNATMLDAKNAVLCALNILGQKNPAVYAHRRLAIEKLDE